MERAFIWTFDHYAVVAAAIVVIGTAILAFVRRPRRWFHWAIDTVVVLAIGFAALIFWFFSSVTAAIEHRTNVLTYAALDGGAVHRVADQRGKVVVLNYWATWCPPCRAELPDLSRLAERYGAKGVVVLTVSDEEPERLRAYLAKYPQSTLTARFTSDAPQGAVQTMAYRGRPTTLVLGRDGSIRQMFIGKRDYRDFDAAVRTAM